MAVFCPPIFVCMKKLSEKYVYIWTILCGIPFGIGMLVGSINEFKATQNIELQSYKGYVLTYGETSRRSENSNDFLPVYVLKLQDKEFFSETSKKKQILIVCIPNAYSENKTVEVWTEKGSSSIEQLAINDEIIITYKPKHWQAWTFLIIGLVFAGMGTIYLIKYLNSTWR